MTRILDGIADATVAELRKLPHPPTWRELREAIAAAAEAATVAVQRDLTARLERELAAAIDGFEAVGAGIKAKSTRRKIGDCVDSLRRRFRLGRSPQCTDAAPREPSD